MSLRIFYHPYYSSLTLPERHRFPLAKYQALYQHLVGRNEPAAIDSFTRDLAGFHKADSVHYDALLHGCIREAAELANRGLDRLGTSDLLRSEYLCSLPARRTRPGDTG